MASFKLGLWNSQTDLSDDEARGLYFRLIDGKWTPPGFDAEVYAFYSRLTGVYPEIDLVPEDDLDSCPWACAIEVSGAHVILAIQPDQADSMLPLILSLAEEHSLVCFDPQSARVHLPPRLKARRAVNG